MQYFHVQQSSYLFISHTMERSKKCPARREKRFLLLQLQEKHCKESCSEIQSFFAFVNSTKPCAEWTLDVYFFSSCWYSRTLLIQRHLWVMKMWSYLLKSVIVKGVLNTKKMTDYCKPFFRLRKSARNNKTAILTGGSTVFLN